MFHARGMWVGEQLGLNHMHLQEKTVYCYISTISQVCKPFCEVCLCTLSTKIASKLKIGLRREILTKTIESFARRISCQFASGVDIEGREEHKYLINNNLED